MRQELLEILQVAQLTWDAQAFTIASSALVESFNSFFGRFECFMQNKVSANCEAGPAFACFAVDRNRVVLVLSEEQDCIDCKLKDHWEGSRVVVHHGKVGQLDFLVLFVFYFKDIYIHKLVVTHVVDFYL